MKILFLSKIIPYPLDEGGKVAQFGFLEYYSKYYKGTILCEVNSGKDLSNCLELQKVLPNLTVKYFQNTANSEEVTFNYKLITLINKVSFRVKKFLRKEMTNGNSILENNFFINPIIPKNKSFIQYINQTVSVETFDLVQIDFIDNADLAFALPASLKKVLVLHDLRFSSLECLIAQNNTDRIYVSYLASYTKKIELSFTLLFDGILTFSKEDKMKVQEINKKSLIENIPFSLLDKDLCATVRPSDKIEKLVFFGPELHIPNKDALLWFIEEIKPQLSPEYDLPLHIIGKWNEETINKFAIPGKVIFHGFVKNPEPIFENSIMISPLRIGSGIRTKILTAFGMGVPVISTSLGCEGIPAVDGKHVLLADTPPEFVKQIKLLCKDTIYRNNMVNEALQFVKSSFTQETLFKRRISYYNLVLKGEI